MNGFIDNARVLWRCWRERRRRKRSEAALEEAIGWNKPPVPGRAANPPAVPASPGPARDPRPGSPGTGPAPGCRQHLDLITLGYTCGCREYFDPDWRFIAVLLCTPHRDWDGWLKEMTPDGL